MTEQAPGEARTTASLDVADGLTDPDPAALLVPDPPLPPGAVSPPELDLPREVVEAAEPVLPDQDITPDAGTIEPPD